MTDGAACDTNVSVEITLRDTNLSPVRIVTDSGGVSEEVRVALRCVGMTRDTLVSLYGWPRDDLDLVLRTDENDNEEV